MVNGIYEWINVLSIPCSIYVACHIKTCILSCILSISVARSEAYVTIFPICFCSFPCLLAALTSMNSFRRRRKDEHANTHTHTLQTMTQTGYTYNNSHVVLLLKIISSTFGCSRTINIVDDIDSATTSTPKTTTITRTASANRNKTNVPILQ